MAHTLTPTPLNKTASATTAPRGVAAQKAAEWQAEAERYETFADTLHDRSLQHSYRELAKDLRTRAARALTDPAKAAADIAEAAGIRKSAAASTDPSLRRELSAVADAIERGEAR